MRHSGLPVMLCVCVLAGSGVSCDDGSTASRGASPDGSSTPDGNAAPTPDATPARDASGHPLDGPHDVDAPTDAAAHAAPDAGALGDSAPPDASGPDVPDAAPSPELQLEFEDCDDDVQCAQVDVPLRWDLDDDPRRTTVYVARVPAERQPARGQLWLVHGGPGQTVLAYLRRLPWFRAAAPDLDLLLLEHRGVGASDRLGCPGAESAESAGGTRVLAEEYGGCLEEAAEAYADRLDGVTTTQVAHDLGALVEAARAPDAPVFVFGFSYGTFLVHRYLTLYPDQATAAVLDSICPPGDCLYDRFDRDLDTVGRTLLDRCDADPFCAGKLGRPAQDAAAAFVAAHGDAARLVLAVLLLDRDTRTLIPPLLYRFARDGAADRAIVERVLMDLNAPPRAVVSPRLASEVLQFHILFQSLWTRLEDGGLANPDDDGLLFRTGGPRALSSVSDHWPLAAPDPLSTQRAETEIPLLMFQGGLDPQTPHGTVLAESFGAPNQHLVTVPDAPHGVTWDSECATALLGAFLRDPDAALDRGCIDSVPRLDFAGDPNAAEAVFGVPGAWEDAAGPGGRPLVDPAEVARIRKRLAGWRGP